MVLLLRVFSSEVIGSWGHRRARQRGSNAPTKPTKRSLGTPRRPDGAYRMPKRPPIAPIGPLQSRLVWVCSSCQGSKFLYSGVVVRLHFCSGLAGSPFPLGNRPLVKYPTEDAFGPRDPTLSKPSGELSNVLGSQVEAVYSLVVGTSSLKASNVWVVALDPYGLQPGDLVSSGFRRRFMTQTLPRQIPTWKACINSIAHYLGLHCCLLRGTGAYKCALHYDGRK